MGGHQLGYQCLAEISFWMIMDATEIDNEEQNDQQKQLQVLTAKVRKISTLASSF